MNGHLYSSIAGLLYHGPQDDDAIAIEAPGRVPMTYKHLREHIRHTVELLNGLGYGRNDRIAVVIPNGPEMAVAFLSVSSGFTCAPLNPLLQKNELEAYLKDIGARAIIVPAGEPTPAIDAARISIIELTAASGEAGSFTLSGEKRPGRIEGGFAEGDDIALVLQTSGTTSRPKLVPLSHGNVCYAAYRAKEALGLDKGDRCLNVMPLFYIHGLVGALLSSMAAGGSVVCTPGFLAPEFPGWLETFKPTWYTAAPAIHQKALESVKRSGKPAARCLRVIRSAAAPLPASVMADMEATFGATVLEGYGMTEAYQISCNPLPPRPRKPGSVGVATGAEIAVIDEAGNELPAGRPGEIVVRSPSMMKGYEKDPAQNSNTFIDGRLTTGDLGYLDGDGYLFITGRIKEMINRGGEKVSPYEVEEALLAHPAVREAVAFPIPDAAMGEEVGAAVVLREGASANSDELRGFVSRRLAYYKTPARIFVVREIPKSANGKIQRLGMVEKLGAISPAAVSQPIREYMPPSTHTERALADIWAEVLHRERVGIHDDFFDLGGSSLDAIRLFALIEERLKVRLSVNDIFQAPTVGRMASRIDKGPDGWQPVILLRKGSEKPPLFCVNTVVGTLTEYEWVLGDLKDDRAVYGLQTPWHDQALAPGSIEELATYFIKAVKLVQHRGPYHLFGYCFGGAVAYEMARQLGKAGDGVGFLGFTDLVPPKLPYRLDVGSMRRLSGRAAIAASNVIHASWAQRQRRISGIPAAVMQFFRNFLLTSRQDAPRPESDDPSSLDWIARLPASLWQVTMKNHRLFEKYTIGPYDGNATAFLSYGTRDTLVDTIYYTPAMGWEKYVRGKVDVYFIPGEHSTMVQPPNTKELARALDECLQKAAGEEGVP